MRRSSKLWLLGAALSMCGAASAEPAHTAAGQRSLLRHERSLDKACSADAQVDCTTIVAPAGSTVDTAATRTATDACTSFNAVMAKFCGMVGSYEPDSPEMLSATTKVIAAKRELMKHTSPAAPAKRS